MDETQKNEMDASHLKELRNSSINLGLDLQGGMYVLLEAGVPELVSKLASKHPDELKEVIKLAEESAIANRTNFFGEFLAFSDQNELRLIKYYTNLATQRDNASVVEALKTQRDNAIASALEIIRNRVDEFGVSEPTIQKYGANRIIVELAGVQDSERARNLIQRTASLEFNLVLNEQQFTSALEKIDNHLLANTEAKSNEGEEVPAEDVEPEAEEDLEAIFEADDILEDVSDSFTTPEDILSEKPFSGYLKALPGGIGVIESEYEAVNSILENEEVQKQIPREGKFLWGSRFESVQVNDGSYVTYRLLFYIATRAEISGGMVQNPQATIASTGSNVSGQWVVNLAMSNEGTRKWSRFTGANIGKQVAIVLDNHVYMAPSIQDKIPTGRTQISGFADVNEAKDIANVLRAGELPAPVNIIEERTVGPSLGSDSITSGRKAMVYGFLAVMVFMLIYYRGAGILANIALLLNVVIVIAVLAGIDATLTLPGIAGLILTIGMAVDANVIIFERIREELSIGKTVRSAIESGYERAFLAIFDANITTLIAAFILAGMGSGPIKGFAITLSTGIICSMFTAVFVTRTIFMTISNNKPLEKLSI